MTDLEKIVRNLDVCLNESWQMGDPKNWITKGRPDPGSVMTQILKNQFTIMMAMKQVVTDIGVLRFQAFEKEFGGDGGEKAS